MNMLGDSTNKTCTCFIFDEEASDYWEMHMQHQNGCFLISGHFQVTMSVCLAVLLEDPLLNQVKQLKISIMVWKHLNDWITPIRISQRYAFIMTCSSTTN